MRNYPHPCQSKRCQGIVVSRQCHSPYCPKCKWRMWSEKNPLRAAFKTLRNHAKERDIEFNLSFEVFKALAEKTDYLKRKGKTSLSLQIDRIDNSRGYHDENVQTLTLRENTRKQYVPYFRNYVASIKMDIAAGIL